ncbi:MAG TPA: ribonuclease P protein component [Acidimicrobiales bacterium]|nr:ribonuclease P protein component [Acidimicrobiales bacterium]
MPGRVRTRRQFAQFSRPSARGRSGSLRVSFVGIEGDGVKVAFAISRKVGSAVVRNRLRRRLRAMFDGVSNDLQQGLYLVKCDIRTKDLTYDELHSQLHEALRGAGVL